MDPRFVAAVDESVMQLRKRLLSDVAATAKNGAKSGGIRSEWRQLVRRLAALRRETNIDRAAEPIALQAPATAED